MTRTFELYPLRLRFLALERFAFPQQSANVFRGALGCMLQGRAYERLFDPRAESNGPSGLASHPRPFVLRTRHLDECIIEPGRDFYFDIHLFTARESAIEHVVRAFAELARRGFGPERSHARLISVHLLSAAREPNQQIWNGAELANDPAASVVLPLDPWEMDVRRLRIEFLSPTELKAGNRIADLPTFDVLLSRIRDRISTLRMLYGAGPLDIDFSALHHEAARVRMIRHELQHASHSRHSARTKQIHPLGGWVGFAEYEGELSRLAPYLEAARWTGVGRQTVWGKGEIVTQRLG